MTNKWQCYLLKLKNKNCQNIKRLPHSFYILKVKCISIFLFIFLSYNFVETLFNIDLCTHVTKHTVILNFYFSHTIFSSVAHNVTLTWKSMIITVSDCSQKFKYYNFPKISPTESLFVNVRGGGRGVRIN